MWRYVVFETTSELPIFTPDKYLGRRTCFHRHLVLDGAKKDLTSAPLRYRNTNGLRRSSLANPPPKFVLMVRAACASLQLLPRQNLPCRFPRLWSEFSQANSLLLKYRRSCDHQPRGSVVAKSPYYIEPSQSFLGNVFEPAIPICAGSVVLRREPSVAINRLRF